MQQTKANLEELHLIGTTVRTSYKKEQWIIVGKIFPCVQRYFHQKLAEQIPNRAKPGTTYCAYTDYASDYQGEYTYFIGEEVSAIPDELPEGFTALTVPAQTYTKFTSGPAPMPKVVVGAWQSIWKMSDTELGGERAYVTDFEIYDERAADEQNIVMDIYVGIKE